MYLQSWTDRTQQTQVFRRSSTALRRIFLPVLTCLLTNFYLNCLWHSLHTEAHNCTRSHTVRTLEQIITCTCSLHVTLILCSVLYTLVTHDLPLQCSTWSVQSTCTSTSYQTVNTMFCYLCMCLSCHVCTLQLFHNVLYMYDIHTTCANKKFMFLSSKVSTCPISSNK